MAGLNVSLNLIQTDFIEHLCRLSAGLKMAQKEFLMQTLTILFEQR